MTKVYLVEEDDYDAHRYGIAANVEAAVRMLRGFYKECPVEWSGPTEKPDGNVTIIGTFAAKIGFCTASVRKFIFRPYELAE